MMFLGGRWGFNFGTIQENVAKFFTAIRTGVLVTWICAGRQPAAQRAGSKRR
jgi:hypothetical protein